MFEPPIPVDFSSERLVTNLTEGLIYKIVPHIVGVQKL
jgi:hypothetical protein